MEEEHSVNVKVKVLTFIKAPIKQQLGNEKIAIQ